MIIILWIIIGDEAIIPKFDFMISLLPHDSNVKFVVENFLGGNFFTPKFVATSRKGNPTKFECIVEMRKLEKNEH